MTSTSPRSSTAVSAQYPTGCTACGAAVGQPCRAKSGRVTDTHQARIDAQFDPAQRPATCRHCDRALPHQGSSWRESSACRRNEEGR